MIFDGQVPQGRPAEGAVAHLQMLDEFMSGGQKTTMSPYGEPVEVEAISLLQEDGMQAFQAWYLQVAQMAQQEHMQQQMVAAAQQFGQRAQQPGKSGPAAMPQEMGGMPAVQGNELVDESLPSSGGGANQGIAP